MSDLQHIQPAGLSGRPTYTHVVTSDRRRTIYVSGQVASAADGSLVGGDDHAEQARQAYENLRIALAAAGATFRDVTKLTIFVVGLSPDVLAALAPVRAEFFDGPPPASTLLGVSALALPEWLIEVEAIAALD